MNNPQSMMIGWTALIFAAGSGYYFARKDLNERRREQTRQGLRGPAKDWREKIEESERSDATATTTKTPASAPSSIHTSTKTPPTVPPEGKPPA